MRLMHLLVAATLFITNNVQAYTNYKITNIHPPQANFSTPKGINNNGQVVGFYTTFYSNVYQVFLWDPETGFQFLGKSLESPKINNLGHVVGSVKVSRGLFWDLISQEEEQFFIWKPGTGKQLIERPKNTFSKISNLSINDHDQIIVTFENEEYEQNMLWHEGKYEKIEALEEAMNISNQQIISGSSNVTVDDKIYSTPVQYDVNLHTLNYIDKSIPGTGLITNDLGEMIGLFDSADLEEEDAVLNFFWSPSKGFKKLPKNFLPISLNNQSIVLGLATNSSGVEYLGVYAGENVKRVDEKKDFAWGQINDHGQITTSMFDMLPDNNFYLTEQAVLLEPVTK